MNPASASFTIAMQRRRATLSRLRHERADALAYIAREFDSEREFSNAVADLEKVLIVLGSPRGGTSAFRAELAATADVQAWPGEHRFPFTLLGLNFPDHGLDTECVNDGPLGSEQRRFLEASLRFECRGEPVALETAREAELFAWEWALRFRVQWPDFDVSLDWLVRMVSDFVKARWSRGVRVAGTETTIGLLGEARARGLPVDPWSYDLPDHVLRERFGGGPATAWRQPSAIIEITPFIVIEPTRRKPVRPDQALLLKASSDAYRIPLLRWLFREKQVTFVHLTRNPAAAINGLLDGWEHRSFQQHDLGALGLTGTVERPIWCFDLIDGWRDLLGAALVEVCERQWSEPHERIQRDLADLDPLRVKFEDFLRNDASRGATIAAVLARARVGRKARTSRAAPRIVNQTAPPRKRRWAETRPWLDQHTRGPNVARVASALGYTPDTRSDWT